MRAVAGERILALDPHPRLHRRAERGVHLRAQLDDHPHADRLEEVQIVHRGGHHATPAVPLAGDRAGDVDPLRDAASERGAERVAVAGQHRLRHHHPRSARRLRFVHALTSNRCRSFA